MVEIATGVTPTPGILISTPVGNGGKYANRFRIIHKKQQQQLQQQTAKLKRQLNYFMISIVSLSSNGFSLDFNFVFGFFLINPNQNCLEWVEKNLVCIGSKKKKSEEEKEDGEVSGCG